MVEEARGTEMSLLYGVTALGDVSLRHAQLHEHPWQTPSLWGQLGTARGRTCQGVWQSKRRHRPL